MTLDEHLVPAAGVRFAAEEVVEADLVERRRRGIGRNVAAHTDSRALGAVHHDGRVPSDPGSVATFDVLVAGEPGLQFGRDGVDVVGRRQRRNGHPLLAGPFQQPQHQVARTRRPRPLQQIVEGLQPFRRLLGVDVGKVRRHTFADHPNTIGFASVAWSFGQIVARELGCQRTTPVVGGFSARVFAPYRAAPAPRAGSGNRFAGKRSPGDTNSVRRGRQTSHPVTSDVVLLRWREIPRAKARQFPRRGALALGCIAVAPMGLINVVAGCTTVTDGAATPDTNLAPAYRQSVSASVSASSATSSIRESQHQQSLTARAVRNSCESLAEHRQGRHRQGE